LIFRRVASRLWPIAVISLGAVLSFGWTIILVWLLLKLFDPAT
jgi:hypothetical protein